MRIQLSAVGMLVGLCMIGLGGCGGQSGAEKEHAEAEHAHDEHAHEVEGPHGGHIIELGSEKLHAELTHDEATHKVSVYILGSDVKTAAPIAAKEVNINIAEDGKASQFVLPAVPQAGESDGKPTYFELVSEPLCKIVCGESEAKNVRASLSFRDGEDPFVGIIETAPHEHEHEHEHEGEHSDKDA